MLIISRSGNKKRQPTEKTHRAETIQRDWKTIVRYIFRELSSPLQRWAKALNTYQKIQKLNLGYTFTAGVREDWKSKTEDNSQWALNNPSGWPMTEGIRKILFADDKEEPTPYYEAIYAEAEAFLSEKQDDLAYFDVLSTKYTHEQYILAAMLCLHTIDTHTISSGQSYSSRTRVDLVAALACDKRVAAIISAAHEALIEEPDNFDFLEVAEKINRLGKQYQVSSAMVSSLFMEKQKHLLVPFLVLYSWSQKERTTSSAYPFYNKVTELCKNRGIAFDGYGRGILEFQHLRQIEELNESRGQPQANGNNANLLQGLRQGGRSVLFEPGTRPGAALPYSGRKPSSKGNSGNPQMDQQSLLQAFNIFLSQQAGENLPQSETRQTEFGVEEEELGSWPVDEEKLLLRQLEQVRLRNKRFEEERKREKIASPPPNASFTESASSSTGEETKEEAVADGQKIKFRKKDFTVNLSPDVQNVPLMAVIRGFEGKAVGGIPLKRATFEINPTGQLIFGSSDSNLLYKINIGGDESLNILPNKTVEQP